MASVFKRQVEKAKGKLGRWSLSWRGADGRWQTRIGYSDKTKSLEEARRLEFEASRVRAGLVDPLEVKRAEAAALPIGVHVVSYQSYLLAKGDKLRHCAHVAGVLARLMDRADVTTIADLSPDRIQEALGRLKAERSARTANHALAAMRAFARWLVRTRRLKDNPLDHLTPFNEKADRKWVRRALTREELERLLAAAEAGPTIQLSRRGQPLVAITGPERALLYRLAVGTGFRANELRSLTPESFHLDGENPTVTVAAAYSKRGRDDVQPIRRELADWLRTALAGKEPGLTVVPVPEKTAKLLRQDLAAAGIPFRDRAGAVLDFHALRATFITHLVQSGANPKVVQTLARHSTITLTMDRYCKADERDLRRALEGDDPAPDPSEK